MHSSRFQSVSCTVLRAAWCVFNVTVIISVIDDELALGVRKGEGGVGGERRERERREKEREKGGESHVLTSCLVCSSLLAFSLSCCNSCSIECSEHTEITILSKIQAF